MTPDQRIKAEVFLALHRDPKVLVLANVWDVAGVRVFERAGFAALATTSSGIAASRGYPDGELIPFEEMLGVIADIVGATRLPVTADIETGYGPTVANVIENVAAGIDVGAVGINIEDADPRTRTLFDVAFHVDKIGAIRDRASSMGLHLVINARTDGYLLSGLSGVDRFAGTLARGRTYAAAGADCIFVPGVQDGELIARLVAEIGAPINVLAGPATPSVGELEAIGVARLSIGGGAIRAALALIREFAAWLGLVPRQHGTGGKPRLGRISKRGDARLRGLLIVCASSVLQSLKRRKDGTAAAPWIAGLVERKPPMVVIVALANKLARTLWALMARNDTYRPERGFLAA